MKKSSLLALNLALTILFCFLLGPAAFKLEKYHSLIGWAGRAPFYLIHFYIGIGVFIFRSKGNWILVGGLTGLAMGLPLAFFSYATTCPLGVPLLRLGFTIAHGLIVSFAVKKIIAREVPVYA